LVLTALVLLTSSLATVGCGGTTTQEKPPQGSQVDRLIQHIRVLSQDIGPRPAGSEGEAETIRYAVAEFQAYGYVVEVQPVATFVLDYGPASVQLAPPHSRRFDSVALRGSAPGTVTARLFNAARRDPCDFASEEAAGSIAVVRRHRNALDGLAAEAQAAGIAGLIVVNQAPELFKADLESPVNIPVVGVSSVDGEELLELAAEGTVEATLSVHLGQLSSSNVIARPFSGTCHTLSGAHYDSVTVSPGANDNASGSAVVLELARTLAGAGDHCFALFGAEENGLDGSQTFVALLSVPGTGLARPRAMLNFDFVGGPGSLLLVGSPDLVNLASEIAQEADIDLATGDPAPGFRSDHLSFVKAGIPAMWFTTPPYDFIDGPQDTLEHVRPEMLERVSRLALLVLRELDGP
jgi:Iap family predicted aminopeptidase